MTMDSATHAALGFAVASPLMGEHPVAAVALIAGAVVPDLDAIGRVFGKKAFFRLHRTYTHSFFGLVAMSCLTGVILASYDMFSFAAVGAFAVGVLSHMLLDWTNSYGIPFWTPFSKRRSCKHWIYFVDVPLSVISGAACGFIFFVLYNRPDWMSSFIVISTVVVAFTAVYILFRKASYGKATRLAPAGSSSLIPHVLAPWFYCGAVEKPDGVVELIRLSLLTGRVHVIKSVETFDNQYASILESLEEFRLMREILPAYRIVEAQREGTLLHFHCRDLALRFSWSPNTKTFGELETTYELEQERFTGTKFYV
jgi:membrane-bound metal-dependent hydrolase YbcI (DUF457 family)